MDGARSRRAEDMIPSAFAEVSTGMTIIIIRPAPRKSTASVAGSKNRRIFPRDRDLLSHLRRR